jgi:polysaccharide pyruvyl transferase CsaB
MRVVISGYYGFGNLGDEAVLAAMVAALRDRLPQAHVVVVSGRPTLTRLLHGVASVPRTGALRALVGADLVISGGGGLVQDVTSARSALYYLTLLGVATLLARATMVYAQGIGPLRRWWLRKLAQSVVNRVTVVTVRDEDSRRFLQEIAVRRPVQVVADPAFALDPVPVTQIRDLIGARRPARIGVALRPWQDNRYLEPLLQGLHAACVDIGAEIVALAFHPQRDLGVCAHAARAIGGQVIAGLSPGEMMAVTGTLDLMVGMRLHALVYAVARGIPLVGLSYDPKIDGLLRQIELGRLLPLASLHADQVHAEVRAAWDERHTVSARLQAQAAHLRRAALRAADLAAEMLDPTVASRGAEGKSG